MQWASCLSTSADPNTAVDQVVEAASEQLGAAPDLVLAFASRHHRRHFAELAERLEDGLSQAPVVGCAAAGVIGAGCEIEDRPALSILAAHLPGVRIAPFALAPQGVPPPGTSTASWDARLGLPDGEQPCFVVIPDPYTCRVSDFVTALDQAYPESTVIGGMVSGGSIPGDNALFYGRHVHAAGVVGVALSGNLTVSPVVAQGCRPVGAPMFVTRGGGNVVAELDGRLPSEVLQELYASLSPRDQGLVRSALQLGIVMSDAQEVYEHGDFLVRNIIALDGSSGAMAVGAEIATGQVVQFHVRDAQTSAEDLDRRLAESCEGNLPPAGALMFSCLGRGVGLYGEPDHDTRALRRHAGPVPVGGFFCSGEIGPVGGRTHLHGYTSAIALFRGQLAN